LIGLFISEGSYKKNYGVTFSSNSITFTFYDTATSGDLTNYKQY
jgi:hypothetical protein